MLVETLTSLKQYTKAEMLCRKAIDRRMSEAGAPPGGAPCSTGVTPGSTLGGTTMVAAWASADAVRDMLLLVAISKAQRLYDEAEDRAETALGIAVRLELPEGLFCAASYLALSTCWWVRAGGGGPSRGSPQRLITIPDPCMGGAGRLHNVTSIQYLY